MVTYRTGITIDTDVSSILGFGKSPSIPNSTHQIVKAAKIRIGLTACMILYFSVLYYFYMFTFLTL
jgi:hypothetical protein